MAEAREDDRSADTPPEPLPLSDTARATVARAGRYPRRGPVGAEHVLGAALAGAGDRSRPDVAGQLLNDIAQHSGMSRRTVIERLTGALDVEPVRSASGPGSPAAVEAAAARAAHALADDQVHNRHLLAAAVTAPLPEEVFDALGTSPRSLRRRLYEAVLTVVPEDPADGWRVVLGLADEGSAAVAGPPTPAPPEEALEEAPEEAPEVVERRLGGGMDADLVDPNRGIPLEDDHLGVRVYVEMLATVIARRDTPLPLSVGLFGDWGSGKSYFMGLLREQVRHLSGTGDEAYLRNVVPIGFNAWSYADTNLWASLGDEIFRALAGLEATEDAGRRREIAALREALVTGTERTEELRLAQARTRARTTRLREELRILRRRRNATVGELVEAAQPELDTAWRQLGIDDEVEKARVLAGELGETAGESISLWRGFSGWRGGAILAAVCLSLVLPALALLVSEHARGLLAGAATALGAALVGAGVVVGQVRAGVRRVGRFVARVDANRDARVEEALARLRDAQAQEQAAAVRLGQAESATDELERKLADLGPERRLYSFLAARAGSQDYRGRMGLVGLIRKDFARLAALMQEWDPREHDGVEVPVERIVLYIDDLDRCEPDQVVEVLTAVHLLLALDLFVVVVGVDPRWLLNSLRDRYRGVLTGDTGAAEDDDLARPVDYLEKIFNIPFRLPVMTDQGFDTMIRELAAAGRDAGRPDGTDGPEDPDGPDGPDGPDDEGRAAPGRPIMTVAGDVYTVPTVAPGSEVDRVRRGVRVELEPLTERELAMLSALGPLVRSPRAAKRLLNLYRMLRSVESLSEASAFLGTDDEPGQYQAVVVLLGLLTAEPELLHRLLTARPDEAHGVPGGLLVRRVKPATWADALAGLRPRERDGRWCNDVADDLPTGERERWARLVGRCARVDALVTLTDLDAFVAWGAHVARFSFLA